MGKVESCPFVILTLLGKKLEAFLASLDKFPHRLIERFFKGRVWNYELVPDLFLSLESISSEAFF
jgi:hypothetical protein